MEPRKREAFIVNERTKIFAWRSQTFLVQKCTIPLYVHSDEKSQTELVSPCDGNPGPVVLRRVEQVLKASTGHTYIDLLSTFDHRNAVCKMWTIMAFDEDLLKALRKTLIEPTIEIRCKLSAADIQFKTDIALSTVISIVDFESAVQTFHGIHGYPPVYKNEVITYSVLLQWKELDTSRKNKCNVLGSLLKDKTLADCCIRSAENTEIKCHGSILAANSDVFHAMLTNGLEESQTKVIEMTDVTDKTINELLAYLYGIQINPGEMKEETAFDLLRLGHKYNISSLEDHMLEAFLTKPDDDFNMDTVLELYLFTVNIEQFSRLCEKTLNILMRNPKTLVSSPAYKDLLKSNAEEAAKLALKLLELGLN